MFSAYYLFIPLITALASTAHGSDLLPKGVIISLHSAAMGFLLAHITGDLWISVPISGLIIALYWLLCRNGRQAKAELDLMTHPSIDDNYDDVVINYLWPLVITTLIGVFAALFVNSEWWFIAVAPWLFMLVPAQISKALEFSDYVWPETAANKSKQALRRRICEAVIAIFPVGIALMVASNGLVVLAQTIWGK